MFKREPDLIIGSKENPYLLRWYITPWSGWWRIDERGRPIKFEDLKGWKRMIRSLPNIYLHKFLRSDDDRALHNHPWVWNISLILSGSYIEHVPKNPKTFGKVVNNFFAPGFADYDFETVEKFRRAWRPVFRNGETPHRVELLTGFVGKDFFSSVWGEMPVWSLFITGNYSREWGFSVRRVSEKAMISSQDHKAGAKRGGDANEFR